jgi:hypothetical protein
MCVNCCKKACSVQPDKRNLFKLLALVVVAGVVVAGIVPRERTKVDLRGETYDLAFLIVSNWGAAEREIALSGNMQPLTDSPIYARTNGTRMSTLTSVRE